MRRTRSPIWRLAVVLAVLVLVVAACGDGGGGGTPTTGSPGATLDAPATTEAGATATTGAQPVDVCEATIGFQGPITGPAAFVGEIQLNWFNFALDTWNEETGYSFQMVEGDNQFDTVQSATLAQQFLDDEAMLASVEGGTSEQIDAAGAVYEAGDPNFTFVSSGSTRPGITALYQGLFRTVPTDEDQGPTTAEFLIAQDASTVFVVDDQSSYSTGVSDTVQEILEAANVTVIRESVSQDVTDFSALVGTIPDEAEFVYLPWQVAANGTIFANQMAEQGKEAVIFGGDAMDSDDFLVAGSYIAAFAPDIAFVEGSESILDDYLDQYEDTNTFGPPVYAAARVVFEAIDRVCQTGQTPDRATVQAEVRNTNQADSILGSPISFTEDGDLAEGRFFIFQIQEDGTKTLVE